MEMPDWYRVEVQAIGVQLSLGRITREEYLAELKRLRDDLSRESDEQDMRDAGVDVMKYHAFNGRNGCDDLLELTPAEYAHYKAEADKRDVTVEELVRMAIEHASRKYGVGR